MTWIQTISPADADDTLGAIYKRVGNPDGTVDHVMRVHSLNPNSLDAHFEVYIASMHKNGPIPKHEREIVGTVVSRTNGCDYCTVHHSAGLDRLLKGDRSKLAQSLRDGLETELTDRERAMTQYATKLTRESVNMHEADLEPLRSAGLTDREILDLACIVAYFNYANRIVLGLGVSLEGQGIGQHPTV